MNRNWKRDTVLFISSQTISIFGSSLVMFAIMWYITLETDSGLMMAISVACGALPTFFLSPFAGVWADRFDRKKLIMISDGFIAFTTLILALLFIFGYGSILLLFAASIFRSIGSGIQNPAVGAFIPQIVPKEKLTRVQGINSSIQSIVMLISPMVSGALLSFTTIEIIFFIDVVTAAAAVLVLLLFLRVPAHEKALLGQNTTYRKDLGDGINYVLSQPYLRKFFVFIAAFTFLIVPVAMLTPLQAARSFGDDYWRLTAIEIFFSLGSMIGGFLIASWGGFRNKIHTMTLACFVISLCTIALGIVPIFWIYLLFMGLIGSQVPLFNTPSIVLLQERVDPNYMGRVFGVLSMVGSSIMPLGMILFGPLADIVAIEWILIVTGILLVITSFFLIGTKDIVAAGLPVITDGEATG